MKNQISGSIALDASALADSVTCALLAELRPLLAPVALEGDDAISLLIACGVPDVESAQHVLRCLTAAGVHLTQENRYGRTAVHGAHNGRTAVLLDPHGGAHSAPEDGYPGWEQP